MGINQRFDTAEAQPLAMPASAAEPSSKLLGLELLRFVSALAVLFFHYNHFADIAGMPPVARAAQPFYALLWPLYDYGQFGVQIFWGISGYIFFWKYGAPIHAGAVRATRFFWLRFSRLYPLHLATLLSVAALQMAHRQLTGLDYVFQSNEPGTFALHLLVASDWGSPIPFTFNGPIWSVSAEVAVYAAFFLLLQRFAPTRNLCVGLVIACLALQLIGLDWNSVGCAGYFFAGGLAALAPAKSGRLAALALAGTIILAVATGSLGDRDKLPMILLVVGPCLLVVVCRDWPLLARWQKSIQFAGNLTYSSYLLNFPLQLLLAVTVAATSIIPPITAPWFLAAYLGVTLSAAALSYRWFELPAQRSLRRLTLKRPGIA